MKTLSSFSLNVIRATDSGNRKKKRKDAYLIQLVLSEFFQVAEKFENLVSSPPHHMM